LNIASGAHSLLQFSHRNYEAMYQIWKEMDLPYYLDILDINNLVLTISPHFFFPVLLTKLILLTIEQFVARPGSNSICHQVGENYWNCSMATTL